MHTKLCSAFFQSWLFFQNQTLQVAEMPFYWRMLKIPWTANKTKDSVLQRELILLQTVDHRQKNKNILGSHNSKPRTWRSLSGMRFSYLESNEWQRTIFALPLKPRQLWNTARRRGSLWFRTILPCVYHPQHFRRRRRRRQFIVYIWKCFMFLVYQTGCRDGQLRIIVQQHYFVDELISHLIRTLIVGENRFLLRRIIQMTLFTFLSWIPALAMTSLLPKWIYNVFPTA